MRKYFVRDNDGSLSWFEASHSGLEDAIQFAQNNKANVETFVDWQEDIPFSENVNKRHDNIVWEFKD